MFRPIKNLITYIQKNASGSAIFGNATSAIVPAETEADPQNVTEAIEAEKTSIAAAEQCQEINKMNKVEVQELKSATLAKSTVTTPFIMNNSFDEDEDIELQIKSSIMLKKPLVAPASVVLSAKTCSEQQIVLLSPSHKHNDDSQALNDELDDFRFEATHSGVAEDFCSISSAELAGGDDTAEECNTEEEEAEERFLDFTPELNGFQGSEIIVLNDADLNSSIASDVLSEDPLAIDDLTQPSILENVQQLDSSSTADEASTSADMLWLDENELKTCAPTPPLKPSNVLPEAPQKRAPLSAITREQQHQTVSSEEQAEELRSDGSDSGLGSETSNLHNTLNNVTDTSTTHTYEQSKGAAAVDVNADANADAGASCNTSATPAAPAVLSAPKPLRSNLKRSLEVDDDDMLDAPSLAVDCASASAMCLASSQQKKPKRSINFDTVQVYYFPRQQGFGCVPSAGGCTLGMASQHVDSKTLTLTEHAAELRRAHRLQLQEINPRGSSSDDSEESEEDYLSEGSGSDLDAESNGFLQPVSPKQRRALLKAAGVRKIDASEKVECRDIRNSREVCGCTCRDFCDPETCACNQAGIKCQVDRAMFPCGCSRDACGNTVGRVEFNPARVRTHYIHTVMRLEMENRQQQQPPLCAGSSLSYGMTVCSSSVSASISASAGTQTGGSPAHALTQSYYGLTQSQSNYSSGYASPAYSSDPAANYYQPHPAAQNAPYNGLQPDMPSLHQQPTPQYQLDSLDAGLFSDAAAATPSYGELMPSYGAVSTPTASSSAAVYHNLSYAAVNGSMEAQVSTSAYSSYYLAPTHSNSNSSNAVVPSTYSSCAVPSAPPYGSAMTTVASGQYHSECGVALDTAAPSCGSLDGAAGSSFIDLNTPIASSSRLSQINDLLQHNRNTTAALVAVSQSASCNIDLNSVHAPPVRSLSASTSSIDTPPIEDTHKISLSYEQLPSPLHPTPIVAVLERESVETSPTPTATTVAATTNAFNTLAND